MEEKRELELKKKVDVGNAAAYLEKLAESIRRGAISFDQDAELLQLDPSQELSLDVKVKIKKEKTKFGLSLSWKAESKGPRDDADAELAENPRRMTRKKEKYKRLKNRMAEDLVAIRSSVVRAKSLPHSEVFERFCNDARAMCTYRKKGEPFYEEFLERLESLGDAYDARSLPDTRVALDSIIDMKHRCHEEYK